MDNGWVKSYRRTLENPIVCKDSDHLAVWMYLLWTATHADKSSYFAGKRITLKPGQLITGRRKIAEHFGISESKVQRILKLFENERQIEQRTSNASRLISITNWSSFQNDEQRDEQQVNNEWTTSEQQVNTIQECKNERMKEEDMDTNVSMSSNQVVSTQIDFDKLVDFFNSETRGVFGEVRKPMSKKRQGMVRARINEHGKDVFVEVVRKAMQSNFLKGDSGNFLMTFDWMIRPTNFEKILSGNYKNRENRNGHKESGDGDKELADAIRRGIERGISENSI